MANNTPKAPPTGAVEDKSEKKVYQGAVAIADGKIVLADEPNGFPRYPGSRDTVRLEIGMFPAKGKNGPFLRRQYQLSIPGATRRERVKILDTQPTLNIMKPNGKGGYEQIPLDEAQDIILNIIPEGGFINISQPMTESLRDTVGNISKTSEVTYDEGAGSRANISELEV